MSLKFKVLICFIAVGAAVLSWPLFAGVCAQRVVAKQRVVTYAQPVYQAVAYQQAYVSPYSYAIGSDLVLEALAEKLAARLEQRIQAQQRVAQPVSIVAEKCARCHTQGSRSVAEQDAPVFFDQEGRLSASVEQRAGMRVAARLGSMPPPPAKELSDDEYLLLKRELETGIVDPRERLNAPPPPQGSPLRAEPGPIPNGERRIAPPSENVPPPPPEKETP